MLRIKIVAKIILQFFPKSKINPKKHNIIFMKGFVIFEKFLSVFRNDFKKNPPKGLERV